MRNRKFGIWMILLVLCLGLSACKENKSVEETPQTTQDLVTATPEPTVTPTYGGTLNLAIRNPETLNPLLNQERSVDVVLRLVFEPLFTLNELYKPEPVLVENYEYSQDYYSITLTLKADKTFSDGTPITANDVAYSIETLKGAPDQSIYKSCVSNISRVSVVDEKNIKIFFNQPYAFALYQLQFPIVSKSNMQNNKTENFLPVGSGLYTITDFTSMKELKLTASESYKNSLYVANITCNITREGSIDENSFNQKLIDVIAPLKFDWLSYWDDPDVRNIEYVSNYMDFIGFNFDKPRFQDKNLRKAIAYAINRDRIAEAWYLSHVTIQDGLIHPESWLNSKTVLTYQYNIEQAKDYIGKTQLKDNDGDGLVDETVNGAYQNITFKLLVNSDNVSRMGVAEMIKEDLLAIGITLEIDGVDAQTFQTKLYSGDYDMVLSGWKLSSTPDFTSLFHSSQIVGGNNFIRFNNEFMDHALENVYYSHSDDALKKSIQELETLYIEELPYFSLYFMHSVVRTNKSVYGELEPTTDDVLNGIGNIYISR